MKAIGASIKRRCTQSHFSVTSSTRTRIDTYTRTNGVRVWRPSTEEDKCEYRKATAKIAFAFINCFLSLKLGTWLRTASASNGAHRSRELGHSACVPALAIFFKVDCFPVCCQSPSSKVFHSSNRPQRRCTGSTLRTSQTMWQWKLTLPTVVIYGSALRARLRQFIFTGGNTAVRCAALVLQAFNSPSRPTQSLPQHDVH
ncbi:hypothetical protein JB92DRAFT_1622861 [Gautieria morchelliformis]|nr:hypothetical protein JB92DRAFT_1622861 [Gautieria morchelliformis]